LFFWFCENNRQKLSNGRHSSGGQILVEMSAIFERDSEIRKFSATFPVGFPVHRLPFAHSGPCIRFLLHPHISAWFTIVCHLQKDD
jgi:hypothetical protein